MFLWCHVRHIKPSKKHPERIKEVDKKLVQDIANSEKITQEDKELISDLDYDGIEFPVPQKKFCEIEVKNNICINVFGYENELVFPIYVSDQKDSMNLLLLIDDDKSHFVYIKDFNRFMFHKTKNKSKNGFVEVVYNVLVVKMYCQNIKEIDFMFLSCHVRVSE